MVTNRNTLPDLGSALWTLRNFARDYRLEKIRKVSWKVKTFPFRSNYSVTSHTFVLEATLTISLKKLPLRLNLLVGSLTCFFKTYNPAVAHEREHLYERMQVGKWRVIQPLQKEIHVQRANTYMSPTFLSGAKLFGRVSHSTKPVRRDRLVNTLTSAAPIGSSIICTWASADICDRDVRGEGKRDEPLRTSAWEAISELGYRNYKAKTPKTFGAREAYW